MIEHDCRWDTIQQIRRGGDLVAAHEQLQEPIFLNARVGQEAPTWLEWRKPDGIVDVVVAVAGVSGGLQPGRFGAGGTGYYNLGLTFLRAKRAQCRVRGCP